MFFCQNCNNAFDIAKSTQSIKVGDTTAINTPNIDQEGGFQIGSGKYTDLVNKTLNNSLTEKEVDGINLDDLIKSDDYKKLSKKEKQIVYNKVQDVLPRDKKKISKDSVDKLSDKVLAVFICNNCGFTKEIEPQTKIFSRTSDNIAQSYTINDYKNMLHSKILPFTRKYNCPNSECKSHTDPKEKEANFFRLNNSYKVKYICRSCGTDF